MRNGNVAVVGLVGLVAGLVGCEPVAPDEQMGVAEGAPVALAAIGNRVGDRAPDWTLTDSAGNERSLSDFAGQVVIMDFWATWCPPCRASMPSMQHLHETMADRNVVVLGMNTSERSGGDPVGYMDSKGFTYTTMLNSERVAPTYAVSGIPAFFVVGVDGTIIHHLVGFNLTAEREMVAIIERHLEEHGM